MSKRNRDNSQQKVVQTAEPIEETVTPIAEEVGELDQIEPELASEDNGVIEGEEAVAETTEVPQEGPLEDVVEEAPAVDPVADSGVRRTTDMLRSEVRLVASEDRAAAWSREQLLTFLETGVQPEKTRRGNWPYDERRARGANYWSASELLDWLEEKISTPQGISVDQIWDEIYLRYKIEGNWSNTAAKNYILQGELPERTPEGLLIDDRFRNIKPASQWTYKELRAAIRGTISSSHEREVLIKELRKRLGLTESYGEALLLRSLETDKTESSMNNSLLTAKLEEYRNAMSRGGRHLTDDLAAAAQTMFYKTIRQVMGRDYSEFHEGWVIILDFINENYNRFFTPATARRGWNRLSLAPAARATFEDLLTLMIHTRSPINRVGEAKLYNLDQILRYVASEKERQNILTFYTAQ